MSFVTQENFGCGYTLFSFLLNSQWSSFSDKLGIIRLTEDEMAGWHHQLNGHEFEQTLGE